MHKSKPALLLAAALFTVVALSAMVYARDNDDSSGAMMSGGMMGRGMMGGGMMGPMSRMMDKCSAMMQGDSQSGRPNEQWRGGRSPAPDEDDHH